MGHNTIGNQAGNMQASLSLLALCLTTSTAAPQYPSAQEEPAVYSYEYGVSDDYSGANFKASESRDGVPTSGSYSVALPDGRTQTVTYSVADGYSGYVADVQYDGEPKYEAAPAYKPAPVVVKPAPVYKPAPVVVKPAPIYHPAPVVVKPTPVYHAAPVVVKPAPVVVKSAPVYHPAPVVVRTTPVYHAAPVVVKAATGYKPAPILTPAKKVFKSKIKYNTF